MLNAIYEALLVSLYLFVPLTIVICHSVQQIDGMQMFWCGNREGQDITNGLMKTRVCPTAVAHRLVFVLQVILDVTHLMMYSEELLHRHCGALLDPMSKTSASHFKFNQDVQH